MHPGFEENYLEIESPPINSYPIHIRNCGSIYSRRLYDVDGFAIRDENNEFLNAWTPAMNDAFEDGRLRLVRSMRFDYRYFVTSEEQKQRFLYERDTGSDFPNSTYYVYRDRDNEYEMNGYNNNRVFRRRQ